MIFCEKTYLPTDYAAYLLQRYAGNTVAEWTAFLNEDAVRSAEERQIPLFLCNGKRYYDLCDVFLFISRRYFEDYLTQHTRKYEGYTQWDPLGASSGTCWDNANTCGPTGWIKSDYNIASSGLYFLEFGVTNWGDEAFDSALAFDFSGRRQENPNSFNPVISTVPEPDVYAMLGMGLCLINIVSRRKKDATKN